MLQCVSSQNTQLPMKFSGEKPKTIGSLQTMLAERTVALIAVANDSQRDRSGASCSTTTPVMPVGPLADIIVLIAAAADEV